MPALASLLARQSIRRPNAATSAPAPALPAQYAALPSGLPLFAQALGVAMNDAATALPPPAGTETNALLNRPRPATVFRITDCP